jgi:hypothetical protein
MGVGWNIPECSGNSESRFVPMNVGVVRAIYAAGDREIDLVQREPRLNGSVVPVGGRAYEIIELLWPCRRGCRGDLPVRLKPG